MEAREQRSRGEEDGTVRRARPPAVTLRVEKGTQAERATWRSGSGKKADSPLESPEGMQSSQHLDFSLVRSFWTSDLLN